MIVGLNAAIEGRGASGSATAVRHIRDALRTSAGIELREVAPATTGSSSRWLNALAAARWDCYSAVRAAGYPDALISPCNVGRAPRRVAHVLVLHDTMVLDHPERFDRGYAAYARGMFDVSVRGASRIVTPSRFSAGRIADRWPGCPPISVVPWPAEAADDRPRALGREPLEVLMVGVTEPHKNQVAGIEAVRLARLLTGLDLRLRLVGPAGRAEESVLAWLDIVDPDGDWTRRERDLSLEEVGAAYRSAWVLLQPSLSEGYGLPLIEAASRGLPAVHSGRGSLPEVAPGDVASVEPWDFATGLAQLLEPAAYRAASAAALAAAAGRTPSRFAADLEEVLRAAVRR